MSDWIEEERYREAMRKARITDILDYLFEDMKKYENKDIDKEED